MRIELFSLRRSSEETKSVNRYVQNDAKSLEEKLKSRIIAKTETDRNPKALAKAFMSSLEEDDTVEGYIFANATDTADSTSFTELFTPLVGLLEEAMDCSRPFVQDGKTLVRHINIYSFSCKGTELKGYCFYAIDKYFLVLPAFEKTSEVSFKEFFEDGVLKAYEVIKEKLTDYPKGVRTFEQSELKYTESHRAKSFFKSFVPVKGDSVANVIRKLIVLLAIGAFIAGAVMLLNFYVFMPWGNRSVMNEIQDIFYSTHDEVIYATNDEGEAVKVTASDKNWAGLNKINKEIVAWVKIDGTKIDYPVLEHKGDDADSQFYLYRNYKKDYSDFGSIFVDYRCTESVNSKNLIFHGHNMGSDDSMFGQLINYARSDGKTQGNVKYYKSHPVITVDVPEGTREYVVFSVMKIDVSNDLDNVFDYLKADFDSDARFMNFVYNIKVRSYLDVPLPINENDSLLTLSTCSYESDNMRTVVVARMLRENEDASKYIEKAKKATPVNVAESVFSEEYAKGNTPWYDGTGKLEGDEAVEYMTQSNMYTVKFLDANGKTLSTQIILEGKNAKAPKEDPRKAADGTYYYVFKGWDGVYTNVTEDMEIKPVFEKKKLKTVTTAATTETETEYEEPAYIPPETEEEEIITDSPETQPPTVKPTQPAETQAPATTAALTEAVTEAQQITELNGEIQVQSETQKAE